MDDYIQRLMQEQGIPGGLDPEVRAELTAELTDRAISFMNQRLVSAMTDDVANRGAEVAANGQTGDEVLQKFIEENVPNKDQVLAMALSDFRTLYLGDKA